MQRHNQSCCWLWHIKHVWWEKIRDYDLYQIIMCNCFSFSYYYHYYYIINSSFFFLLFCFSFSTFLFNIIIIKLIICFTIKIVIMVFILSVSKRELFEITFWPACTNTLHNLDLDEVKKTVATQVKRDSLWKYIT